jgi:Mg-chelatase subunit ChlD/cell division protein FtsB
MKTKLIGIALFALTLAAVMYNPQVPAKSQTVEPPVEPPIAAISNKPRIDVVFVLDTTGSMSELIHAAKEKIWSIASTMASAQQTPDIRIGLVAYRDRTDSYVTKVVDLSDDLDSVYATLMDFEAEGGGDTPESVNKALYDAVHAMSWTEQDQAYKVIFLVGDAPPHMDYNEVQYPEIVASAAEKGIVVNTIQCGDIASAVGPWTQIAALGQGNFFQVEQSGSAVAYTTPYDKEIAELSARLDDTRLFYGTPEQKAMMQGKMDATDRLHSEASFAARARRGVFNASEGGRVNMRGDNDLVEIVVTGAASLEDIEEEALPEALVAMAPEEQKAYIEELSEEREELKRQIQELGEVRDGYIKEKVEEAGGLESSLDQKLYDTVKEQAGEVGLEYDDGPAY